MEQKEEKSSNPTLRGAMFQQIGRAVSPDQAMTVAGSINKTGLLLLMVVIGGVFSWNMAESFWGRSMKMPAMWISIIAGFVLALLISFKPTRAAYLSQIYALCQGVFLGIISVYFNNMFPGIALNAVILTVLVATVMLFVYRFRIIKVTKKLAAGITMAVGAIMIFYLGSFILSFFGINSPAFVGGELGSSWTAIGINFLIVGVAAFSLLLDFNFIEEGSDYGAPKYMEWYGAFGLTVTLVWLYLEILKLLARFSQR